MQAELIGHAAPPLARRVGDLRLQQRLDRGVVALDRGRDERVQRLGGWLRRAFAGERTQAAGAQTECASRGQQSQSVPACVVTWGFHNGAAAQSLSPLRAPRTPRP